MVDPTLTADQPPTRYDALDATPSALTAEQATTPAPPTPAEPLVAGRRFAKYELLEQVAQGGMGVVYRARDTVLGRVVALKMIRSGVLAQPDEVQRFYREAQAAALLSHPNIVPILDVGECEGRHFFTMAFAPGGSLAGQRDRAPADVGQAVARVEKVARAVQHAHEHGILHRDLKPGNILLDEHGEPLVGDFGLAKFLDSDVELTHSGQVMGTPAYMAPEQASGDSGGVTRQTDVWALGVLLYELLAGRRPFVAERREELWRSICTADPESLRSRRPDLDAALETIILKCLEKEPARRYASAGDLADDLVRWQRGEPARARPRAWPARAWRAVRRRGRVAAAVALLLLATGSVSLLLVVNDHERPLRAAQAQLAKGQPVTLIAETGPPAWSAVRYRQATTKLSTAEDDVFTVFAFDSCLLELLHDPQCERFRYRAEVRFHNANDIDNEAGIYFAHSRHRPDPSREPYHSFIILGFSALPPDSDLPQDAEGKKGPKAKKLPGKRVLARLALDCVREFWPQDSRSFGCLRQRFPLPDLPAAYDIWHSLELDIAPEVIRGFWDGQPLGEVSRDALRIDTDRLVNHMDTVLPFEPPFRPRQPLGLYVRGGKASFRNVVVEPLPKTPN